MHWVVDGMNLIGSRPDGWWRDRAGARRRLVGQLATLVGPDAEVTVVFDGRPGPGEIDAAVAAGITARFAPGGPNAADHAIVALLPVAVGRTRDGEVTVVTSDAALADVGAAGRGGRGRGEGLSEPPPGSRRRGLSRGRSAAGDGKASSGATARRPRASATASLVSCPDAHSTPAAERGVGPRPRRAHRGRRRSSA